jgi:hypothetical protein
MREIKLYTWIFKLKNRQALQPVAELFRMQGTHMVWEFYLKSHFYSTLEKRLKHAQNIRPLFVKKKLCLRFVQFTLEILSKTKAN